MSTWFHLRAAGMLIRRRKGPVFRMVIVAFIGTLWCVGGAVWTLSTYRSIQAQATNVQVDVLLKTDATDQEARAISRRVASMPEVDRSRLMTEIDVWREFTGEVGVDDDLRAVVSMPRIVRFSPVAATATTPDVKRVVKSVENTYSSLIEEVVWSEDYVGALDERRKDLILLGAVAGAMSLLVFLIGLIYAFRAELHVAGGDLRVGSLLGATPRWIATPHILVSGFSGIAGLFIASALVWALMRSPYGDILWLTEVRYQEFGILAGSLLVLGLIVSLWQSLRAARKAERTMDS